MAVLTSMHAPNRVLLVLVSLLLLAVASVCAAHTQAHALSDKPDEQPVTTGRPTHTQSMAAQAATMFSVHAAMKRGLSSCQVIDCCVQRLPPWFAACRPGNCIPLQGQPSWRLLHGNPWYMLLAAST